MLEEFHEDGWHVAPLEKPHGRGINLQIERSDAIRLRDGLVGSGYPLYREIADAWRETVTGSGEFLVQDLDGYLLRFSGHLGERETALQRTNLEGGSDV